MYKAITVTLVTNVENDDFTGRVTARSYDSEREVKEKTLDYASSYESDLWKALDEFLNS